MAVQFHLSQSKAASRRGGLRCAASQGVCQNGWFCPRATKTTVAEIHMKQTHSNPQARFNSFHGYATRLFLRIPRAVTATVCIGVIAMCQGRAESQTVLFQDDFAGPELNPIWQAELPPAPLGGRITPATYAGAPNYAFESLGGHSVLRLSNLLAPLRRCGWSTSTNFFTPNFRYEVRFNSLNQTNGISIDGFIEIWLLDAVNPSRWDIISPFGGCFSTCKSFFAGSSVDSAHYDIPFEYTDNTWYRLVLECRPGENIRGSICDDTGTELVGHTFAHNASAFASGFKLVLAQAMDIPYDPSPVDVAVDYVRLTALEAPQQTNCAVAPSGLVAWWRAESNAQDSAGENNGSIVGNIAYIDGQVGQAFSFDGNSHISVPASQSLDVGTGSGLTIECWVFPACGGVGLAGC